MKCVFKSMISATILAFVIGAGAASAQAPAAPTVPVTPAAATVDAPAAPKVAKPKLNPDEKKKVSQACSTQANDKKLHGKDRQKFRATCIRHGGAAV